MRHRSYIRPCALYYHMWEVQCWWDLHKSSNNTTSMVDQLVHFAYPENEAIAYIHATDTIRRLSNTHLAFSFSGSSWSNRISLLVRLVDEHADNNTEQFWEKDEQTIHEMCARMRSQSETSLDQAIILQMFTWITRDRKKAAGSGTSFKSLVTNGAFDRKQSCFFTYHTTRQKSCLKMKITAVVKEGSRKTIDLLTDYQPFLSVIVDLSEHDQCRESENKTNKLIIFAKSNKQWYFYSFNTSTRQFLDDSATDERLVVTLCHTRGVHGPKINPWIISAHFQGLSVTTAESSLR